jgi:hypothetical protein
MLFNKLANTDLMTYTRCPSTRGAIPPPLRPLRATTIFQPVYRHEGYDRSSSGGRICGRSHPLGLYHCNQRIQQPHYTKQHNTSSHSELSKVKSALYLDGQAEFKSPDVHIAEVPNINPPSFYLLSHLKRQKRLWD